MAAELRYLDVPSVMNSLLARVQSSNASDSLIHNVFPPHVVRRWGGRSDKP